MANKIHRAYIYIFILLILACGIILRVKSITPWIVASVLAIVPAFMAFLAMGKNDTEKSYLNYSWYDFASDQSLSEVLKKKKQDAIVRERKLIAKLLGKAVIVFLIAAYMIRLLIGKEHYVYTWAITSLFKNHWLIESLYVGIVAGIIATLISWFRGSWHDDVVDHLIKGGFWFAGGLVLTALAYLVIKNVPALMSSIGIALVLILLGILAMIGWVWRYFGVASRYRHHDGEVGHYLYAEVALPALTISLSRVLILTILWLPVIYLLERKGYIISFILILYLILEVAILFYKVRAISGSMYFARD